MALAHTHLESARMAASRRSAGRRLLHERSAPDISPALAGTRRLFELRPAARDWRRVADLHRWVRVSGEFGPEHHPVEHMLLVAHAIVAYAFLVILGAMIPVHIPLGWNRRRNRLSGSFLVGLFALLSLTALGLYYIGEDALRAWTSLIHWVVGIAALPGLLVHVIRNRRLITTARTRLSGNSLKSHCGGGIARHQAHCFLQARARWKAAGG